MEDTVDVYSIFSNISKQLEYAFCSPIKAKRSVCILVDADFLHLRHQHL